VGTTVQWKCQVVALVFSMGYVSATLPDRDKAARLTDGFCQSTSVPSVLSVRSTS
jgi:hypothetical protein